MKIAFNPSTVAALTTPPNNKDITFDLRGQNIFARGVKFCGTDTWRDIKINNVSIGSNILDLRDGDNTTLTNINGVVTINSTWRPVVDNLTSDSTTSSLSANQGRILKALIDDKSDSGHNHDDSYLKLTGGTMSGTIYRNSGGVTISGRDNAIIRQTYAPGGSSWNPIACVDTETGTWTLGHLSSGDSDTNFHFCFSTNADYNAGNNKGNYVTLRNKVGTIALLSDIPSSLKNPHALTISLNGTSQGPYDGSAAKNINITPSSIGAATSGHNHDGRYVYNYGATKMDGASKNKNALGMANNSGITGDWWCILQAAWNSEYRWNSQIAFPTQNRNGMYYRSGLDDNTKWGSWVKLLDVGNSYVTEGKGIINGTTITQVDNAINANNADTVDGYHASSLWRSDGGIWNPGANILLTASGNNQEWSFDIRRNDYTGCFWQVWDNTLNTLLKVNADNGKVYAPYNFVGNLEGNAYFATKSEYSRSLLGRSTSGSDYGASSGNLVFAEWNTMHDSRWYLKATGYECRVAYASKAASATKLETARNIFGLPFDGTNDIGSMSFLIDSNIDTDTSAIKWTAKLVSKYTSASTGGQGLLIGVATDRKYCRGGGIAAYATRAWGNNTNLAIYKSQGSNYDVKPVEVITITDNLNVGIGTTSPAYKLHVVGDIYTTTGFKKNGSSDSYVLLGGGGHQTISSLSVNHAVSASTADSANKLNKWFDSRVADLNQQFGDGSLRIFHATSSTTANKCPSDATVLHLAWDNNEGWDSQLAVGPSQNKLYFRGQNNYKWNPWQTVLHDGNSSISGNTIKINNTSLTVANSNHNHDNIYLKLAGGTMQNQSRIGVNGDLYIGDANNNGWLYFQDIASQDGTDYWTIYTNGSAEFEDISTRSGINVGGQIYRDGIDSYWYKGRDNALLRDTSAIGYHTLWSLKTTNGSWDFGEYTISGWSNIPMLSYITDSDYNSGNNVTTYQIKFPLASGTVALTSDIPNPTNYYWADVKISSTANSMTQPQFYSVKAYQYSLTNANGSESYNLAYLNNNIINMGNNSQVMHINASNILFYTNSTQCIDINTQGHIGIGKTASQSAQLTVASITELTTLKLLVGGEFRQQPVCVACGKVIDPISSTNINVSSSLNITATYTNNHYRINLANLRSSMISQNNVYAQITPITKYVSYRTEAIKDGSYIYLDVYCNARTSFYFCVWTY